MSKARWVKTLISLFEKKYSKNCVLRGAAASDVQVELD